MVLVVVVLVVWCWCGDEGSDGTSPQIWIIESKDEVDPMRRATSSSTTCYKQKAKGR